MRIVAVVAVVAVLLAGGFWLARDRSTQPAGAATTDAVPSADGAAGTNATDPTAATDDHSQHAASTADEPTTTPAAGDSRQDAATDSVGVEEPAASGTLESADATEADLSALLPVGFSEVPFVSDQPRRQFQAAEQVLEDGLDYVALLHTNRGDIVVDLFEDLTPVTVNNFVFLSLNRYYQDVPFHRVLEDFMAQTGDPTGTGSGGPGYQFQDEFVDSLAFDSVGQLAMANAGPGTNGSQFFITFAATPWLTGAHTIFGEVMSGSEVLDAITRVDPSNPSAIVMPSDTLDDLSRQGITLPGTPDTTVEAALEAILGTSPVLGQSFTASGYRGVMGQVGNDPAYGFFPQPDTLLDVVIGARPTD